MSEPDWRRMGFLTPDAPECLREVWALQALLQQRLADAFSALALRTAEPTWQAALDEAAGRCTELISELSDEAGEAARLSVADDDVVREFDGAASEVLASGHVPSLIATGYAVVGELALVPIQLLEEVSGPFGRVLCGRILSAEQHRVLGRLAGIVQLDASTADGLRRLLRHLDGGLYGVYQAWRQTFHVLGVDGEDVSRLSRETAERAYGTLGLEAKRSDLGVFAL
jgi:hypothetical protein